MIKKNNTTVYSASVGQKGMYQYQYKLLKENLAWNIVPSCQGISPEGESNANYPMYCSALYINHSLYHTIYFNLSIFIFVFRGNFSYSPVNDMIMSLRIDKLLEARLVLLLLNTLQYCCCNIALCYCIVPLHRFSVTWITISHSSLLSIS